MGTSNAHVLSDGLLDCVHSFRIDDVVDFAGN